MAPTIAVQRGKLIVNGVNVGKEWSFTRKSEGNEFFFCDISYARSNRLYVYYANYCLEDSGVVSIGDDIKSVEPSSKYNHRDGTPTISAENIGLFVEKFYNGTMEEGMDKFKETRRLNAIKRHRDEMESDAALLKEERERVTAIVTEDVANLRAILGDNVDVYALLHLLADARSEGYNDGFYDNEHGSGYNGDYLY